MGGGKNIICTSYIRMLDKARSCAAFHMVDRSEFYDEEEGFLLEELTPRPRSAAALLQSPAASSYSASSARTRSRYHAHHSSSSFQSMLESFTKHFDLALRPSTAQQPASPLEQSTCGATDGRDRASARAERNAAKEAKRVQMLACSEVAGHVVSCAEVLAVQRLAREQCTRPCKIYRDAVLRGAATVATQSAGSTTGDKEAQMRRIDAEAEATAIVSVGGSLDRSPTGNADCDGDGTDALQHPSLNDPLVAAICARVMRSAEAKFGLDIDNEARVALRRRPAFNADVVAFDKAAILTHRLAFNKLRGHAMPLIAQAVARVRERSNVAASTLLAPLKAGSTEEERASWGLTMLRGPPPPVVLSRSSPSAVLPRPARLPDTNAVGGDARGQAAHASSSASVRRAKATAETGSAETGSAETGSAETGSAETGSAESDFERRREARRLRVRAVPCAPSVHPWHATLPCFPLRFPSPGPKLCLAPCVRSLSTTGTLGRPDHARGRIH